MCGRYVISVDPETYRVEFGFTERPNFPARYNVAPTQPVPIVLEDRGVRHFMLVRWGFLPSWVKDPKDFPLVINARGETLQTKPTFKAALKRRRCIFLADGFYEWRRHGRTRGITSARSSRTTSQAAMSSFERITGIRSCTAERVPLASVVTMAAVSISDPSGLL